MTFCFSLSINFFFFLFYLKYTRIIYTDEHTQRTIWLKHLSFLSFFFFFLFPFFPNEACKQVVVSPVRMKIKRVGWWIVINDSGGTVKTFPFLFPVWTTELYPAVYGICERDGTVVAVYCYCSLSVYCYCLLFSLLQLCSFLCAKGTEHTGPFLDLMVLDGISYEKYSIPTISKVRSYFPYDPPFLCFVCWFHNDRRFSVAGSFSIVSRTSVICAIT